MNNADARAFDVEKTCAVLKALADDMLADATALDGKPFAGAQAGEAFGNLFGAVCRLAKVVGPLALQIGRLQDEMDATQDVTGDLTGKLQRISDSFAHIAYERPTRAPRPFQDFIPEGPKHFHTGDSEACYGKDCIPETVLEEVDGQLRVEALLAVINQPVFQDKPQAVFRLLVKMPDFVAGWFDGKAARVELGDVAICWALGEKWALAEAEVA